MTPLLLLEPIRPACHHRLSPSPAGRLRILLSPLGSDAAARGAVRPVASA